MRSRSDASAGAGRACGVASSRGARRRRRPCAGDDEKTREQSASAPQVYTCNASPKKQTMHESGDRGAWQRFQVQ
eukprot:6190735-Pleurochrysis_carterae.AAC.1